MNGALEFDAFPGHYGRHLFYTGRKANNVFFNERKNLHRPVIFLYFQIFTFINIFRVVRPNEFYRHVSFEKTDGANVSFIELFIVNGVMETMKEQ